MNALAVLSAVKITAPYLFDGKVGGLRLASDTEFLRILIETARAPEKELSHEENFRLALAAQWATAGSFVPLDLDGPLHFRLWSSAVPFDTLDSMVEQVLRAYRWDGGVVSNRWVVSSVSRDRIIAHHGEWFAVAVAAYGSTRTRAPALAARVREAIEFEVTREAKVYLEFKKAQDGVGLLKAASLVARNLGELDRAIETWGLCSGDPLYDFAYRAGHDQGTRAARFAGALAEASRLAQAFMTIENHRHLALRIPRCLRRSPDFLLPVAPFLDEWGERIGAHPSLRIEEVAEVVETLLLGWEKLKGPESIVITEGYPRAVAGILKTVPGGVERLEKLLSPQSLRSLKSGLFHSLECVSQSRFEGLWAQRALHFVRTGL